MAGADIPDALRDFIRERARGRCEYCLTSKALSGIRCQTDHITPRSRGGATTVDNLCLACAACMVTSTHEHTPVIPNQARKFRSLSPASNVGMSILLGAPMAQK